MTTAAWVILSFLYLIGGLGVGLVCVHEKPSKNPVDLSFYGLAVLFWPLMIVSTVVGLVLVAVATLVADPLILKLQGGKIEREEKGEGDEVRR